MVTRGGSCIAYTLCPGIVLFSSARCFVAGHVSITEDYAMMSLGEELKSAMPSFMQFCSRVDQGNVQEDWWTAGSDAGKG